MTLTYTGKSRRRSRGQIFLIFAIVLPVLLMFLGLALDVGFAWIMKALLSRSVDAAALAGMRNIDKGTAKAQQIAQEAFDANFGTGFSRDTATPTVTITVGKDGSNNNIVNVTATATINTFFIRIVPGFSTMNISSSAQATQPQLLMSLMLDRSGSMALNGGGQALPGAVTSFIDDFNNTTDEVAEVSFASIATVDVSMRTNFQTPITDAVNGLNYAGATFSQAALTDGMNQITGVQTVTGQNVVKVAVFFTDGWANTINDNLNCPATTNLNYGGCSPAESATPTPGWCANPSPPASVSNVFWMDPTTGNTLSNCNAATFPSQQSGTNISLTQAHVSTEALYRAVQVANNMRTQNITVYSIGLGSYINQTFMQEIANDPASPTYDSTQPVGEAVFAPDSSQLTAVFNTIAQKILLRISQ
jgi:Flp pilus assembly protein TadG